MINYWGPRIGVVVTVALAFGFAFWGMWNGDNRGWVTILFLMATVLFLQIVEPEKPLPRAERREIEKARNRMRTKQAIERLERELQ